MNLVLDFLIFISELVMLGSVPNVGVSTRFRRAGEARPRKTAIV